MIKIAQKNGYVKDVQCNKYHAGNRRLALDGEWAECCGCGAHYSRDAVAAAQVGPKTGYTGAGGLAR